MNRAPTRMPRSSPVPLAWRSSVGVTRARRFGRSACAALGVAALGLLLSSACGDEAAKAPAVEVDPGPVCERGTRNCACIGGSGCRDGLLCIAGLCSARTTEGPREMEPAPRPLPPLPDPGDPDPDAGAPPSQSTSDASDAGPDASLLGNDEGLALDAG